MSQAPQGENVSSASRGKCLKHLKGKQGKGKCLKRLKLRRETYLSEIPKGKKSEKMQTFHSIKTLKYPIHPYTQVHSITNILNYFDQNKYCPSDKKTRQKRHSEDKWGRIEFFDLIKCQLSHEIHSLLNNAILYRIHHKMTHLFIYICGGLAQRSVEYHFSKHRHVQFWTYWVMFSGPVHTLTQIVIKKCIAHLIDHIAMKQTRNRSLARSEDWCQTLKKT
jgi:hypothetical protein